MRQTILLCFCLILFGIVILSCGRPENATPADKPSTGISASQPSASTSDALQPLAFSAQYIRTDGYHDGVRYPVVTVIDSADGLSRYYEEYKDLYDFSHRETVYADTSIGFVDAIASYDAAWFESHRLLVILCEEGSGSIGHEVTAVTGGSAPAVEITRLCPECYTDDMAEWHILIELDRAADLSGEIAVHFAQKDV
ncbi:MAG: hypothetical protein IK132_12910 [Clostridia bacterium]|nr:hypothetical protein [Clostridia bacterium]